MFESRRKLIPTAVPTLFVQNPLLMDSIIVESANNSLVESECTQSNYYQSIQMNNDITILVLGSSINVFLSCSFTSKN